MAGLFERIHEQLGNGSWLIGRVTGSEYAKADAYPDHPGEVFPREPWFVRRDAAAYGIALDAHGKIAWGRADIGGDPIVAVLTKQVSDAHLAGLRRDGVSYIFAGERELNLALALDILNRELEIERLLLCSTPSSKRPTRYAGARVRKSERRCGTRRADGFRRPGFSAVLSSPFRAPINRIIGLRAFVRANETASER
jgi:hypothetical protein